MYTIKRKLISLLITCLLISNLSKAQINCSEKYNPRVDKKGIKNSPDYKKEYTLYIYFTKKSGKDTFFTPIYKLDFVNYDNNSSFFISFVKRTFLTSSMRFLRKKYSNFYFNNINNLIGVKYCLKLEDLKDSYRNAITKAKQNGLAIKTQDTNPESFIYKSIGRNTVIQDLNFVKIN